MWENYQFFFIGCVGAIAPEILRLYRLRSSLKFTWSGAYILISILFVLLGGFVAYILEPSNNYAAFYSGVGTPFIINAITKETQQAATPQDIPVVRDVYSDSRTSVPNTEEEITRVNKGKRDMEPPPLEAPGLKRRKNSQRRKASLKKFLRAL